MLIVAIDLAERYSAAILLQDGRVAAEFVADFGSRKDPWLERCERLDRFWHDIHSTIEDEVAEKQPYKIIIEDVYPFAAQPKWVYRIQGLLMRHVEEAGLEYEMVLPLKWQRYFGYKKEKGRTTKTWAKAVAAEKGYVPQAVGKARIDLQDAFLIAQFAKEDMDGEGTDTAGAGPVEVTG